ncbi:YybH family protein [Ornithinimicrobium cavernae]|uniref:YybH family protein n=1 Tax=Ornithinimicrobium cavernae TaxID=2666047 RepID=UPI001F15B267|nr:SgcJ/EcaC family oxidoreductase [Ornithinimicrobium cavernae]
MDGHSGRQQVSTHGILAAVPCARPQDVAAGFAEAWNRGDAGAIADLFSEDADFINVVGFWWTRREQIRHNHAYGFEQIFPGSTMTVERLRVRDLGDTAVVHARWRVEGQRMPGRGSPARPDTGTDPSEAQGRAGVRRGILTFVVHRQQDGTWLAVAAQNTDIVPGAQTNVVDDHGRLRPEHYGRH